MKRLAVISDVHGNYKALEAFLEYCEEHPVDGMICLGDYVTDSPYPERTMKLLYEMRERYTCYMIRGNRENYMLDNEREDQGWKPSSANGALYYTSLHLTAEDMDFLGSLPEERSVEIEGYPSLHLCHGTPGRVRGNVTLEEGLRETALEIIQERYLLGGHSHCREIFTRQGKTYLNPGSLGLAMNHTGKVAEFAVMTAAEGAEWDISLHSIPYDVDSFLKDFTESGLDEYGMVLNRAVKKFLMTGRNYFFESITEAEKIAGCPIREVPEEIWDLVARKLEL